MDPSASTSSQIMTVRSVESAVAARALRACIETVRDILKEEERNMQEARTELNEVNDAVQSAILEIDYAQRKVSSRT